MIIIEFNYLCYVILNFDYFYLIILLNINHLFFLIFIFFIFFFLTFLFLLPRSPRSTLDSDVTQTLASPAEIQNVGKGFQIAKEIFQRLSWLL